MCGIVAAVGGAEALANLSDCHREMAARGYDAAGAGVVRDDGLSAYGHERDLADIASTAAEADETGRVVGRACCATHAPPVDANGHPRTDCTERIAVVLDGVLENGDALRDRLTGDGHRFATDADSEAVAHLVEAALADADGTGSSLSTFGEAVRRAVRGLSGRFAVAVVHEDGDAVFVARQRSPLVLGLGSDASAVASDVPTFLGHTDRVVSLEDGDLLRVDPDGYAVHTFEGDPVDRPIQRVDWTADSADSVDRGRFDHFTRKEIHEQPSAVARALHGRIDTESGTASFETLSGGTLATVERVTVVASGTSFQVARYGAHLLRDRGVPARACRASEYVTDSPPARDGTLVVGVTRSGETAATLSALRQAAREGLPTLAVTNVADSTVARECDDVVFVRAGPEVGLAATKTFTAQVATLVLFVERLVPEVAGATSPARRTVLEALATLPAKLSSVLDGADRVAGGFEEGRTATSRDTDRSATGRDDERTTAAALAERYRDSDAYFFVGRGTGYPVALEGAQKLAEMSYEHAEGFPAGELKHGPLALVTLDTPVFAVFHGRHSEKLRGTMAEVGARGAPVVAVTTPDQSAIRAAADETLLVPETHPDLVGLLASVQFQLLAYAVATQLDRPVDRPRNLAGSVTVE